MKKIILLAGIFGFATAMTASADPQATWMASCKGCHGADGKGQTMMGKKLGAKDYSDAAVQAALTDAAAVKAVKEGVTDKDGKTVMKPTSGLSDADITALVAYMRTLKK